MHFEILGEELFFFRGRGNTAPLQLVSALQAKRILNGGCVGFLASVVSTDEPEVKLEFIPIVGEFPDVFPEDLPGLPPERDVEFSIDLAPGTGPISKAPYRMAPAEFCKSC